MSLDVLTTVAPKQPNGMYFSASATGMEESIAKALGIFLSMSRRSACSRAIKDFMKAKFPMAVRVNENTEIPVGAVPGLGDVWVLPRLAGGADRVILEVYRGGGEILQLLVRH